jgi:hypothetical protein
LAAQQKADFAGNYEGTLSVLHVKLHVTIAPDGNLSATVDSPDQGMVGLPCANVIVNGQSLSFTVPAVRGTWAGVLSSDRNSLSGIWTQGASPVPLNLVRVNGSTVKPATAPLTPAFPGPTPGVATAMSSEPACTGMDMLGAAYYWDGSTWKKMSPPAVLKTQEGYSIKGGLISLGGRKGGDTVIYKYEGVSAPTTLGSLPRFVMCAPASTATANFVIGRLDVKKNYRQIESLSRVEVRVSGNLIWVPEKRRQPLEVKRVSQTAFEIKPVERLLPGQYLLVGAGQSPLNGSFDFGVQVDR